MDVWGKDKADVETEDGNNDWEAPDTGKDALIVLIDVRKSMFEKCQEIANEDSTSLTWFQATIQLLIKHMKSKIIADDRSLLGIVFFGSNKKTEGNTLENIYELQSLEIPSARRIKELQDLLSSSPNDIMKKYEAMDNHETIAISNGLWHCGISFSNANLKKADSQRIWIFTNDDKPVLPDAQEAGRVQKQVQNHVELNRSLSLFCITPPGKNTFNVEVFYSCAFSDFSNKPESESMNAFQQPAFPVTSLNELVDGSLRKRFKRRRLTTFSFSITKDISIGVELYALAVIQRKSYPIALKASTNLPLKSETKWLCEGTGAYLTNDKIRKYIEYGGERVYFSSDDIVQLKYYDAPGLQLICFKPLSSLKWSENIRSPYFVYPSDGYIEGSTDAFCALLKAMELREKYALARLIARKTSEPRLVALIPQIEKYDEFGQVQPSGLQIIFLPYSDDIRDVKVENEGKQPTPEQVDAAKVMIDKLTLPELPVFDNPEIQKHYASIQALALGEEQLEFDETLDTTLPDAEGFNQEGVKAAIQTFREVCGDDLIDQSNAKRKTTSAASRSSGGKKSAKTNQGVKAEPTDTSLSSWKRFVESNSIQKKTVTELKEFLHAHEKPVGGKKSDLITRISEMVMTDN